MVKIEGGKKGKGENRLLGGQQGWHTVEKIGKWGQGALGHGDEGVALW